MKGYFEIGIYECKNILNIGTLWRSAYQLGASGIFTIGKHYKRQASDTVNGSNQIPLREYNTFEEFLNNRPKGALLVGIEMGGIPLNNFAHPKQAIYLLGAEDNGLPDDVKKECHYLVELNAIKTSSYNVSIAGSIVMYHRTFIT